MLRNQTQVLILLCLSICTINLLLIKIYKLMEKIEKFIALFVHPTLELDGKIEFF